MTQEAQHSIVIGASGGIGAALTAEFARRGRVVHAFSRSAPDPRQVVDIIDEASVAAAAQSISAVVGRDNAIAEIVVSTGFLHDDSHGPEKSWRDIDAARLARSFAVNAIGPALVAKHFLPLLPRNERAVFAALSARVGSIGDNRLGGWYGYRASKAALNQIVRTLAIELCRTRPHALCVGLHPGTVATRLSAPFQANVPQDGLFSPDRSARRLVGVMERLTAQDSGDCFDWAGQRIAP